MSFFESLRLIIPCVLLAMSIPAYQSYFSKGFLSKKTSTFEKYFSSDYNEARAKFREAVTHHSSNIELHSLPLEIMEADGGNDDKEDLSIDIALLRRSKSKLMIHISGTHGVEGFAGSAAQLSLLDSAISNEKSFDNDETKPTILFIHALNAYGFAKLRRFNENNVDLNRNFLTESEFKEKISQDPNHAGYVDLMDLSNPTQSFMNKWDSFYFDAVKAIVQKGYKTLKSGLVTGNYHFKKSLFYGGQELQPSYVLLKKFLFSEIEMDEVTDIGLIDLHTGLGKCGYDSIAVHNGDVDEISKIFGGQKGEYLDKITSMGQSAAKNESDEAMSGYDAASGFLPDGLASQVFPPRARKYLVSPHTFSFCLR